MRHKVYDYGLYGVRPFNLKELKMSEIIQLTDETKKIFPYVADKVIIDYVNGLHVAQEQNTVQKQRTDLFVRMCDGLSGKTTMRQTHINDHLIAGLEASKSLIMELSNDMQKHSVALFNLYDKVENLENNLAETVDFVVDLKHQMNGLKGQILDFKAEFNWLKRSHLAEQQMNRLMDKWKAGGLNQLSPIARCYAVLDALSWGALGDHLSKDNHQVSEILDNLRDKMIICLAEDLGVDPDRDMHRDKWLELPENAQQQLQEVLAFQGNWCLDKPKRYETTFTATQWLPLSDELKKEYELIPFHMSNINRVTQYLINERFYGVAK